MMLPVNSLPATDRIALRKPEITRHIEYLRHTESTILRINRNEVHPVSENGAAEHHALIIQNIQPEFMIRTLRGFTEIGYAAGQLPVVNGALTSGLCIPIHLRTPP